MTDDARPGAGRLEDFARRYLPPFQRREQRDHATPWTRIARHMMGLYNGVRGARRWRQVWSDHRLKERAPSQVMALARASLEEGIAA